MSRPLSTRIIFVLHALALTGTVAVAASRPVTEPPLPLVHSSNVPPPPISLARFWLPRFLRPQNRVSPSTRGQKSSNPPQKNRILTSLRLNPKGCQGAEDAGQVASDIAVNLSCLLG